MCERVIENWTGSETGPHCVDCRASSTVRMTLKQELGFVRLTIDMAPGWRALGHGSPPVLEGSALCPSCAAKRLATQGAPTTAPAPGVAAQPLARSRRSGAP